MWIVINRRYNPTPLHENIATLHTHFGMTCFVTMRYSLDIKKRVKKIVYLETLVEKL